MKDKLKSKTCSQSLKSLADPERLKLIECLQAGPRSVGELAAKLGAELANVSHHLGVLYDAKLVARKRKGKSILYSLNPQVFSGGKKDVLELGCCRVLLRSR
jgi:DNA-binding transcriptional ArsR family regulator